MRSRTKSSVECSRIVEKSAPLVDSPLLISEHGNTRRVVTFQSHLHSDSVMDTTTNFISNRNGGIIRTLQPSDRMTPIQEFYHEKCVLITGATGFMGKILLDKLLRSCPSVGTIYVMLRAKKDQAPSQRLESLMQAPIFERLRRERGILPSRIVAVNGDIERAGLGLSAEDQAMLCSNVSIVFHVAATVRFDEKLKTALNTNLAGTAAVVQLCKEMHQLKAMVYVSTAYSNSPRHDIEEVVYSPPVDPDGILGCMDWMSDEQFEILSPSLLGKWPNSYAYSKQLAENLVLKHCENMPVAIFRPAIVTSTLNEPIPGWVDNLNGPSGITAGAAIGIIRCFRCDSSLKVDLVPVDMAVNAMLAVAWRTANISTSTSVKVYNFVSSAQQPIRWHEYVKYCEEYGLKHPPMQSIWYYMLVMTNRPTICRVLSVLLHDLPAHTIDLLSMMLGKKPKMVKMYSKIDKFNELMSYFTTREWNFRDSNMKYLANLLSPEDRNIFPCDLSVLRWRQYVKNYMAGIRLHLLNEKPDNLDAARRKFMVLYLMHRGLQLGFVYVVIKLAFTVSSFLQKSRFSR